MLIRFKKTFEKIAMGLLSFMPGGSDVKTLQATIKEYETNPNWHLYLWREEDDILGAIGVKVDENQQAIIQHISVNPSHRNQGIGTKMINEVKKQYEKDYTVTAEKVVEEFYHKCVNDEE